MEQGLYEQKLTNLESIHKEETWGVQDAILRLWYDAAADENPMNPSRYSVGDSENEYMDVGRTVLRNKKEFTDLKALFLEEEKALAKTYEFLLAHVRSTTPITAELIRCAHEIIFGDLYEWAGRWRRVTISKTGVTWPPPDYLDEAMAAFESDVLSRYPVSKLRTDRLFCNAVGHIQGEFLAIHPFREGNARTIKLVTNLLSIQTGRLPLRYDASKRGQMRYIAAAKAAMVQNYKPMVAVTKKALIASRDS